MSYPGGDDVFTVEDEPDRTIPEDHIVRGRLVELKRELVTPKDPSKDPFEKLLWWFEVTEQGLYAGRKVKGQTGVKFSNHPNNRARQWAEALLRRDLGVNISLSRSDLLELPCDFTVRHDKGTDGRVWERVDEVMSANGSTPTDEPPF